MGDKKKSRLTESKQAGEAAKECEVLAFDPQAEYCQGPHRKGDTLTLKNPREKAADRLANALSEVNEAIQQLEPDKHLAFAVRRLAFASSIVTQVNSLLTGQPTGQAVETPHQDDRYIAKTPRSKARQPEVLAFICRRFAEKGSLLPVTSAEIVEGTSLRSRSQVRTAVGALIRDGMVKSQVSVSGLGGGYIPSSQALAAIREAETLDLAS